MEKKKARKPLISGGLRAMCLLTRMCNGLREEQVIKILQVKKHTQTG